MSLPLSALASPAPVSPPLLLPSAPPGLVIGVAGMVGAGKTTFVNALAHALGFQKALESVDAENPWLDKFYAPGGQKRYALELQLHFLATRMESMRRLQALGGDWILDRTWYEDAEIFARGLQDDRLMTPLEFSLYERLYAELLHAPAARPPHVLIYLHAPLGFILRRIQTRGRPTERSMAEGYWGRIHGRYEAWAAAFTHAPVLSLDVRDYDLKRRPRDILDIGRRLADLLPPDHTFEEIPTPPAVPLPVVPPSPSFRPAGVQGMFDF